MIIEERIENGLKRGKIRKSFFGQYNNKRYNNNSKKGDTDVFTIDGYSKMSYNSYVATVNPNKYPL